MSTFSYFPCPVATNLYLFPDGVLCRAGRRRAKVSAAGGRCRRPQEALRDEHAHLGSHRAGPPALHQPPSGSTLIVDAVLEPPFCSQRLFLLMSPATMSWGQRGDTSQGRTADREASSLGPASPACPSSGAQGERGERLVTSLTSPPCTARHSRGQPAARGSPTCPGGHPSPFAWTVSCPPHGGGGRPCPGGAPPCRRRPWPRTAPAPPPSPTGSWCSPRPCWAARWKAGVSAWGSGQQSAEERARDCFRGEPRGTHDVLPHRRCPLCLCISPGALSQCRAGARHPEKVCLPPFGVLVRPRVLWGTGDEVPPQPRGRPHAAWGARLQSVDGSVPAGRGGLRGAGVSAGWKDVGWMEGCRLDGGVLVACTNGCMSGGGPSGTGGPDVPRRPGCTALAAPRSWRWAGLAGTSSRCYCRGDKGRTSGPHVAAAPGLGPRQSPLSPRPPPRLPSPPTLGQRPHAPPVHGAVQALGPGDDLQGRAGMWPQPEHGPPEPHVGAPLSGGPRGHSLPQPSAGLPPSRGEAGSRLGA